MSRTPEKFELTSEPSVSQPQLPLPEGSIETTKPVRRKRDSARLVWDSKPKRPPSPRDIEFQTAEVVIPNPARDAETLPFTFRDGILHNEELDRSKMNRLIWGDNLLAMQALLAHGYEGKIGLIYVDPPFDSKADYSHRIAIGNGEYTKGPSVIERLAYSDTWEAGRDSYLDMLYPRLQLMRRLLSDAGSIYLHIGPGIQAYVKALMDEVFGYENCRSEIVWKRTTAHSDSSSYGQNHDYILFYSKTAEFTWNSPKTDYEEWYVERYYRYKDADGRMFMSDNLSASGLSGGGYHYTWKGAKGHWRCPESTMARLDGEGKIFYTKNGIPRFKRFLEDMEGLPMQSLWDDLQSVVSWSQEATGFETQKPEAIPERIINASSRPGDLVADFFCGSGTTATVAENLGRRWITSDLGKVGVQVARARLVEQDAKPFLIENIGNYQREMIYLSGGRIGEMQRIILKLYGATPHPTFKDLGTRIGGTNGDAGAELVYVGYPDRPTTAKKVEELARQAETLDGGGYKRLVVLAWDYDYNFDADWEARKKAGKKPLAVDVQRRMIPPDVYDYLKKAKTEADIEKLADKITFHEKPYLKLAKPKVAKPAKGTDEREVSVGIDRYVIFDLPVPDKEQPKLKEAIKDNFAILIDYWAVDWDYDGATFRSQWQAIRGNGKRAKVVATEATQKLKSGRKYTIAIRVVDVFGNDAAATVEVEI